MRFVAQRKTIGVRRALIVISFGLSLSLSAAHAEKVKDLQPQGYVNDFAGVLDAQTQSQISELCKEVDEKTQAQIAVVIVKTLEGLEAADFGNQLFKKWGIGHKGDNRGVLVLVAINDRKYWTEVGYGLEPILPDGKVGGFGRELVPSLQAGDYNGGVLHLTAQIAGEIAADRGISLDSLPNTSPTEGFVDDMVGPLSPQIQARITALCTEVEQKAHAQIAVMITGSHAYLELGEFAQRVFKKYRVGRKDDNRGVLLVIVTNERKYWIEVGSGLKPVLTEEKVDGLGREIVPFLRANDYTGAVLHLTAQVAGAIAADRGIILDSLANLPLSNAPQISESQNAPPTISQILSRILVFIVIPIAFVWALIGIIKSKPSGGRRYSGGSNWVRVLWVGGGFGGGGFGGFGGGSSGGGGAGGSW